jgi:hypothetical protein
MLEISAAKFEEGRLAAFLAPGNQRGWSPGQFLVVPPSCFALLGC